MTMTPKQQYKLALSAIRHLRRINRNRAAMPTPTSDAWRVRSIANCQQEILRYSVEQHIMHAAATAISSMKFNDYRFMSNRILGGNDGK